MAVAGFSFSYATSANRETHSGSGGAGNRIVGSTPLRFTVPLAGAVTTPPTYDLGDACFGATITRYLSVTGGIRSYSVQDVNLNTVLTPFPKSSLVLNNSGFLFGSVASALGQPARLTFTFGATASDSKFPVSNTVDGLFQITLMTCPPNDFRFAVSQINNGVVGLAYSAQVDTLGGERNISYTVPPNSNILVDGVIKSNTGSLESIGLSLASDGTLHGRPLQAGRVSFVARAVDNEKRIAKQRMAGSQIEDQLISFTIEDNNITSADYTTMTLKAKGDVGRVGKDNLSFNGILNLNATTFLAIDGSPFFFRVGGATFNGVFDAKKGRITNGKGKSVVFADGSRLKAGISRRGVLRGKVSNATLGKSLDAVNILNRGSKRYGVQMVLGELSFSAEVLEFATRKSNDKFAIDYTYAKVGTGLAGTFQLISIAGKDQTTAAGQDGVVWSAKFLAAPRLGIDANSGLDGIKSVNVRIGTKFDLNIPVSFLQTSGNGSIKLKKTNFSGEIVDKFTLNTRTFVGTVRTQPLSAFATGIPQAKSSAGGATFNFGLDIDRNDGTADFHGESSKGIIARGGKFIQALR